MDWTVADVIKGLAKCRPDAPIWVVDVHRDGVIGDTFHVVNAYMDRISGRATIIVEPLAETRHEVST